MPRVAKKRLLAALAAERAWERLREPEWNQARAAIPGLTPRDVEASGIPAEAPWCGVRRGTFAELEESLAALTRVYEARPDLRRFCRAAVIQAKDRAKGASRNPRAAESTRAVRAEMAEWMLVWLGDPALFPAWASARRRRGETAN